MIFFAQSFAFLYFIVENILGFYIYLNLLLFYGYVNIFFFFNFIYKIHFCEVLLTPSDLVSGFWLFLVIVQVTNMGVGIWFHTVGVVLFRLCAALLFHW